MCAHENAVRTPEFGVQADANGERIADDVATPFGASTTITTPSRKIPVPSTE